MPPQLPFEPEEQQPGLPMEQVKGAVPVGNISQIHPGPWLDPKKTIAGNIGSAYNRLMDSAVNLSPTERQQHPVESAFGAAHNFISMTPDELKQHPYQAMGRTALKTAGDLATVYGIASGGADLAALPETLPRMVEYGKNLMSGGVDAWKNMVGARREARLMAGAGDATKAAVKDRLAAYTPLTGPRSAGAGAEAAAEGAPKFNVGAGKSNLIDESTSPNPEHGDSPFSKTKEHLRNDALRGKWGPKTQQAAIERGLMGEAPVYRPKEAIIESEGPRTPAQDRAIKMAAGIDTPEVSEGSDAYAGPDRRNVDQSVLLNRRVSAPGTHSVGSFEDVPSARDTIRSADINGQGESVTHSNINGEHSVKTIGGKNGGQVIGELAAKDIGNNTIEVTSNQIYDKNLRGAGRGSDQILHLLNNAGPSTRFVKSDISTTKDAQGAWSVVMKKYPEAVSKEVYKDGQVQFTVDMSKFPRGRASMR